MQILYIYANANIPFYFCSTNVSLSMHLECMHIIFILCILYILAYIMSCTLLFYRFKFCLPSLLVLVSPFIFLVARLVFSLVVAQVEHCLHLSQTKTHLWILSWRALVEELVSRTAPVCWEVKKEERESTFYPTAQ